MVFRVSNYAEYQAVFYLHMPNITPIGGHGKQWTVRVIRKSSKSWGWCDYDKREVVLTKESQTVGIDREVLIHELLHKAMPFLTEECVDLVAIELDDALEVCGY